ncbi:hypothetical protein HYG86_03750 [Alkalicella caledoniensis]|uniref:Uncharacterized protein n=1 Tax=Alkalicella caledoniensis TaxID=2731377 RepID=A0A7G9W5I2_ALKCA|nr:hypothetical protein [Alkalicella caledoniensis]QNO13944.1 hypothetical protein HYG86_03750 [Alkalicella caledoniensis]
MGNCNCTSQRNRFDVILELTLYYLDTLPEDDVTLDEIEETFITMSRLVNNI